MQIQAATAGSYTACELLGLCDAKGPGVAQSRSKGFLILQTVRTDSGHIQRPAQCAPAALSARVKNGWSYTSASPGAFLG